MSTTNQSFHRLLSIIIPVYNAADTLSEQLDALKNQEYSGDWEIIIVNNGSTDNSVQMVQKYQHSMPHLHLVHALEKRSVSYARNVGVQVAQGDAFLFCDADDIVAPGWLSALAKALEKSDLVVGAVDVQTLNWTEQPKQTYARIGPKYPAANFLPYAIGCNAAVSRKAFEAVGGFSENFPRSADVDLSWRLQLSNYRLHLVPEAVVYHRYRSTLRSIWTQSVSIGEAEVNLYRHFRGYGMPPSSIRDALRRYKWLIKRVLRLWRMNYKERKNWVRRAAICWGRLRGGIRYKILYM